MTLQLLARRGRRLTAVILAGSLLTLSCGGKGDAPLAPSDGTNLAIRLDEWKITTGSSQIAASVSVLQVQNVGTSGHELLLIRSELATDKLPVKSGEVDEESVDVVARTKELSRRQKTTLSVSLRSGNYVLICNISGHYALGMRTALQVK